jgi:cobalt-zinc-cadmium resistance protein CzcA
MPGVHKIRSQTSQGLSAVVVEFDIQSDFWRARQFVTERLAQVAASLPPGTGPPELSSATTRLAEVYEFAVEGDLPPTQIRDLAEWLIRYNLLSVSGVAEVLNMGGYLKQYRVAIDPDRMRSYGVSLQQVKEAIQKGNENAAGGFISTGPTEINVRGIGRYNSTSDIAGTVITQKGGVPIYLHNVASVEEGTAIRRGIASKNGKEAVVALVIKQPYADTIQVVEGIRKTLEDLKTSLPGGVRITPYYDQTHLINQSLASVINAILIGAVLVVLVLLLFLGDVRSTVIVSLSIPLSIVIAGILMRAMGVSLNTMSLGGLAIAVGMMVDASIIMVENIHHRLFQNKDSIGNESSLRRTAFKASSEVGRPIAFATLIVIAVFFPLFPMGGVEGLLFRPLAITVMAAMFIALLISLSLTSVLGARFLNIGSNPGSREEVPLITWIKKGYAPALEFVLKHHTAVIAAALILLIPAFIGMALIGKNFMPRIDEGAWVISTITPPETSLEENDRITKQIEDVLLRNPDVTDVVRRNGRSEKAIGCVLPVNSGEIIVNLKPKNKRSRSSDQILAQIRGEIKNIPGVATSFTQPLQLKIDESLEGTPAPLQVKLFGPDIRMLAQKGAQIGRIMEKIPGIADVRADQVTGIPQLQIQINREAAARYGVSVKDVSELVSLAIGGEELTQVWEDQRSFGVFVRYADERRRDPERIRNLMVDTPANTQVPLSQLADIVLTQGPNVIWRESMNRRYTINASIQGRDLEGVVNDIKKQLRGMKLPQGYYVAFGGQFENQQRAMRSLFLSALLALAIVFILLYLALKSVSQAAMILATVPSAFLGGVVSLLISGETINVSSAVGFIALFGIVVQNSLVLLTQVNGFLAEGVGKEEAIRLASTNRLRPKLMTVASTALGLMPILFSSGLGAEIEKPLAIVMIGGLLTSTIFTLLILPAVYLKIEIIMQKPPSISQMNHRA